MLQIKNLTVKVENKILLENISLNIKNGETHVLMGPNGAGKSSLCKAIMHYPGFKITGDIIFNKENITSLSTDKIAKLGIYYIDQNPMEIEGVSNAMLYRSALQDQNIDIFKFNKESNRICEQLQIPKSFIHRDVNVGMSGGEKKKNELLGMLFLKPKLVILDEIDSGLDVDAIKIVAKVLTDYQKESNCSILIVSHQPTLLKLLKPQIVHLVSNKTIIKTKDSSLIDDILNKGFQANIMDINNKEE